MAPPLKILVVDDDADVRAAFRRSLLHAGYAVIECENGREALEREPLEQPVLIILDIDMPELDGRKTLAELRRRGCSRPVLIVTHIDDEASRVDGLELGADDYIGKPCSAAELVARVRAVLRRYKAGDIAAPTLRFGDVVVDLENKMAVSGTTLIRLTRTEFALLALLREHIGRPVSRERIIARVWGGKIGNSHALDTHLWRLRKKLGDTSEAPRWILNQSGIGYTMAAEVMDADPGLHG
jgi:DNA-binding response OmpR family regulator